MTQMYLFTSPMARKKKAECHFDPNTYRVFGESAENIPSARWQKEGTLPRLPSNNLIGQPINPRPESEHRHNRPNPHNVNFLRHDVRLLNEPVCDVNTAATASERHQWWPHRTSAEEHKKPPRTDDTIVRQDYQYRGSEVTASGRFGANSRRTLARGIVPVNTLPEPDKSQRFWQEGISYEHQFNSRIDPQYPVRSKRHGAFVWDQISKAQADKLHARILGDRPAPQQLPELEPLEHESVRHSSRPGSSKHQQQHSADYSEGETQNVDPLPAVVV